MIVTPIKTRIFREGEDIIAFITEHIPRFSDGTVLAVTSKIVALSESRTVTAKTKQEIEKVIRRESEWATESFPNWWLTIRDGMFAINAGIDKSNADGKIVLLPKNSFHAAEKIRTELKKLYSIKNLGIIITDSRVAPLRRGVFAMALGYAGIRGLRDYRKKPDIFGRKLKVTQVNIPDSLATAAALEMGEGNEQQPLAMIEDASVEFAEKINKKEIRVPLKGDIFRPLLKSIR